MERRVKRTAQRLRPFLVAEWAFAIGRLPPRRRLAACLRPGM